MPDEKPLDVDLLVDVIVAMETLLRETGRKMGPVRKAKYIVQTYKEFEGRKKPC